MTAPISGPRQPFQPDGFPEFSSSSPTPERKAQIEVEINQIDKRTAELEKKLAPLRDRIDTCIDRINELAKADKLNQEYYNLLDEVKQLRIQTDPMQKELSENYIAKNKLLIEYWS